ncbi:MAG: hypothetical protein IJ215_01485 [Clostridia bacterium]|nr:hypothetical protein [Clostridia bacterium]
MTFGIIALFLLMIYLLTTFIMFLLISRKSKKSLMAVIRNSVENSVKPFQEIIDIGHHWMEEKLESKEVEDVSITSHDGLKLHGILIQNPNAKGIMIECHGYRSTAKFDLFTSCHEYYDLGYSLLLIDERTSNMSEGKYITLGIRESEDIIQWCEYVNHRFVGMPIILAGISMGASSVLMAVKDLGEDKNVKAVMADCGYVSAWDEVIYCLNHYFHLPGKCFIHMINFWCLVLAKFSLKEKNTIECIKDAKIPILFVHGEEDDYVPKENSFRNYEEYAGTKKLVLFPKANHGTSYLVDPKKYVKMVEEFLNAI